MQWTFWLSELICAMTGVSHTQRHKTLTKQKLSGMIFFCQSICFYHILGSLSWEHFYSCSLKLDVRFAFVCIRVLITGKKEIAVKQQTVKMFTTQWVDCIQLYQEKCLGNHFLLFKVPEHSASDRNYYEISSTTLLPHPCLCDAGMLLLLRTVLLLSATTTKNKYMNK